MNEEAMLIEAILNEEDDNVHRGVYADWLLDHDNEGRARPSFARRRCWGRVCGGWAGAERHLP